MSDTLLLNASSLVAQFAGIAQSLLVMRFLRPEAWGIWLGVSMVLSYGAYANLGIEYGMGLRLPYHQRKGTGLATSISDTAYVTWSGLVGLVAAAVAVYALCFAHMAGAVRLGLGAVACMLVFEQQTTFRTRWQTCVPIDFKLGSAITIGRSLTSVVVLVTLTYRFGLSGFIVGSALVSALTAVAWLAGSQYRFERRLSWPVVGELLRAGAPVLGVVLLGLLIQTVDRVMIVGTLGATALGYYGVTGLGGGFLYGLISQAGNAVSPHIASELGKPGAAASDLQKFLIPPSRLFAFVAAFGIVILLLVIPIVVQFVLPQYVPGLTAFRLFIPGFYFLAVTVTANNVLYVVLIEQRREGIALVLQAMAVAIETTLCFLLLRSGAGIAGAAAASTTAYAVYGCATLFLAARETIPDARVRRAFLRGLAEPFVYVVVAASTFVLLETMHADLWVRLTAEAAISAVLGCVIMLRARTYLAQSTLATPITAVLARMSGGLTSRFLWSGNR